MDSQEISRDGGVTAAAPKSKSLLAGIEGGSLAPNMEITTMDATFDTIEGALTAYKEKKLPVIGMGKNRGYGMSGGLGAVGLLSLLAGGMALAKGKTALGALGVGVGAGAELGAVTSLPKKVPVVGYFIAVREDYIGHTTYARHVLVKLPQGLGDTMFKERSMAQIRQRIKENAFVTPSMIAVEREEAKKEHANEVASGLDPAEAAQVKEDEDDDPPAATPDPSSSSSAPPASVSLSSSSADDDPSKKDVKPKKKTPAISELSSAQQKAASAGSGIVVT